MMNKNQLKEWFLSKISNCYQTNHKNKILFIYDKQFIRDRKLAYLTNDEIITPTVHNGIILFEQDLKSKAFYCNYDVIWAFLKSNYSHLDDEIQQLIVEFLNNDEYLPTL